MKIDRVKFNIMLFEGYIMYQTHPVHTNLRIFSYTDKTQYEYLWNDVTSITRQLSIDWNTCDIVGKSFDKFHNYEPELALPSLPFKVIEKCDGSIISVYYYKNEWIITSKCSFTSDHANKAREILEKKYKNHYQNFDKNYTYIFEVISPDLPIIVNYNGITDLYLLGIINTDTFEEIEPDHSYGFPLPQVYPFRCIEELINSKQFENFEGYVVKYENNFRFKFKFEDYKRIAKSLTHISLKTVWEVCKGEVTLDGVLERLPDEYYDWFKTEKLKMEETFRGIVNDINETYRTIIYDHFGYIIDPNDRTDKKLYSNIINTIYKDYEYKSMLYNMLNSNQDRMYKEIWRKLEPFGRMVPKFYIEDLEE